MSANSNEEAQERDCHSCAYFYVTWKVTHRYGCKAMDFMSPNLPCLDVLEIEGRPCLSYRRKSSKPGVAGAAKESAASGGKRHGRRSEGGVNIVV